ncbi:serine carboxypeptidase [Apiospora arundinis]
MRPPTSVAALPPIRSHQSAENQANTSSKADSGQKSHMNSVRPEAQLILESTRTGMKVVGLFYKGGSAMRSTQAIPPF